MTFRPNSRSRCCAGAALCCFIFCATLLHAQKIKDPKASLLDVPARRAFLQSAPDPRIKAAVTQLPSCGALGVVKPPPGVIFIPRHYLQDSHGPTNPAEAVATRVYAAFEMRITAGMNRYVATGSEVEAKCALDQLDGWARAKALLNYDRDESSQAWYQVEWTLSSAGITDSVLVTDPTLDPGEQQRVTEWLDEAAHKDISFERPNADNNNHHYWRALAATSIGIAASDDKLFRFGVSTYKEAIDDLDSHGAFPKEMARHERALPYQIFALDPLILIAEFASRQGMDLYSYNAHGQALRTAIVFFGRAMADPSLIKAYTPEDQIGNFGRGDLAGIDFYAGHFGAANLPPALVTGLAQPTGSTRLGGSATVLAGR